MSAQFINIKFHVLKIIQFNNNNKTKLSRSTTITTTTLALLFKKNNLVQL